MTFIDIAQPPDALLRDLEKDPRLVSYGGANFGMALDLIEPATERLVPIDRFFVRSNGPVPVIDPVTWRLTIDGNVSQPQSFSLDDLRALPRVRLESFLECAGNGRTSFSPLPPGTPWVNDAIGNAVWDGVPLASVLDLAKVKPGTVDIVSQGGDFPEMRRGLPLAAALDPDVVLAWSMNDTPLPVAHGGPVRLLVPGWAGIASTKWIVGLTALDRPFDGFWNTDNYVVWDEHGDALRPVTEMPPKSLIVHPEDGARLAAGAVALTGWAWSGYAPIRSVEISTDGGSTWRAACLDEGNQRSWRRWTAVWDAAPGHHRILARATDERGLSQPRSAPWNAKGYLMNSVQQVTAEVTP
ncbi:MAG: sulfite oxidase [Thermomicrobiales bacterium]